MFTYSECTVISCFFGIGTDMWFLKWHSWRILGSLWIFLSFLTEDDFISKGTKGLSNHSSKIYSYISANSIRPEPSFVGSSLKNITVPEGRDVVLSCTVKNLDGHKVAWIHYDRSAILTVDKTVITRNARIGVSHEGTC